MAKIEENQLDIQKLKLEVETAKDNAKFLNKKNKEKEKEVETWMRQFNRLNRVRERQSQELHHYKK